MKNIQILFFALILPPDIIYSRGFESISIFPSNRFTPYRDVSSLLAEITIFAISPIPIFNKFLNYNPVFSATFADNLDEANYKNKSHISAFMTIVKRTNNYSVPNTISLYQII